MENETIQDDTLQHDKQSKKRKKTSDTVWNDPPINGNTINSENFQVMNMQYKIKKIKNKNRNNNYKNIPIFETITNDNTEPTVIDNIKSWATENFTQNKIEGFGAKFPADYDCGETGECLDTNALENLNVADIIEEIYQYILSINRKFAITLLEWLIAKEVVPYVEPPKKEDKKKCKKPKPKRVYYVDAYDYNKDDNKGDNNDAVTKKKPVDDVEVIAHYIALFEGIVFSAIVVYNWYFMMYYMQDDKVVLECINPTNGNNYFKEFSKNKVLSSDKVNFFKNNNIIIDEYEKIKHSILPKKIPYKFFYRSTIKELAKTNVAWWLFLYPFEFAIFFPEMLDKFLLHFVPKYAKMVFNNALCFILLFFAILYIAFFYTSFVKDLLIDVFTGANSPFTRIMIFCVSIVYLLYIIENVMGVDVTTTSEDDDDADADNNENEEAVEGVNDYDYRNKTSKMTGGNAFGNAIGMIKNAGNMAKNAGNMAKNAGSSFSNIKDSINSKSSAIASQTGKMFDSASNAVKYAGSSISNVKDSAESFTNSIKDKVSTKASDLNAQYAMMKAAMPPQYSAVLVVLSFIYYLIRFIVIMAISVPVGACLCGIYFIFYSLFGAMIYKYDWNNIFKTKSGDIFKFLFDFSMYTNIDNYILKSKTPERAKYIDPEKPTFYELLIDVLNYSKQLFYAFIDVVFFKLNILTFIGTMLYSAYDFYNKLSSTTALNTAPLNDFMSIVMIAIAFIIFIFEFTGTKYTELSELVGAKLFMIFNSESSTQRNVNIINKENINNEYNRSNTGNQPKPEVISGVSRRPIIKQDSDKEQLNNSDVNEHFANINEQRQLVKQKAAELKHAQEVLFEPTIQQAETKPEKAIVREETPTPVTEIEPVTAIVREETQTPVTAIVREETPTPVTEMEPETETKPETKPETEPELKQPLIGQTA
jgi:hypothetical protein